MKDEDNLFEDNHHSWSQLLEYSKEITELGERRRYRRKYLFPALARWGRIGSYAVAIATGVIAGWAWLESIIIDAGSWR
jgi:hypothetical protein